MMVVVVVGGIGTFPVCPSLPCFLRLLCCCYATTAYVSYSASFFFFSFFFSLALLDRRTRCCWIGLRGQ
ncbi:uncharacterized protein J3D65DRAFT_458555 [Phyllosticta citribraziliensis]|uniref:Secreted peptide n=1 Tax=Phyllosticta citribraziliensis TaxID=989973 RepID=A0ABR1LH78_9PEZI